jgi:hypothetical protein
MQIVCTSIQEQETLNRKGVGDINNKKIMFAKGVKFLLPYFEADLKWNHQVEAIRQKCIKPMANINYI